MLQIEPAGPNLIRIVRTQSKAPTPLIIWQHEIKELIEELIKWGDCQTP